MGQLFVTPEVVATKHMKENKSPGVDVISAKILKETVEQISTPLAHVFNMSLQEGIVPLERKEANILPLFKKVSRNKSVNYSPVSLASVFYLIFLKASFDRCFFLDRFPCFFIGTYLSITLSSSLLKMVQHYVAVLFFMLSFQSICATLFLISFPKILLHCLTFVLSDFILMITSSWISSLLPNGFVLRHCQIIIYVRTALSVLYFFVVLFGYVGTTIYYSNGNCCMPCN